MRTTSHLSDKISEDLKRHGMKFVGTTVIYAYLQAVGVIYSHEDGCFLAQKPSDINLTEGKTMILDH
jgi:DNA-3-methyladenine glycosylase I